MPISLDELNQQPAGNRGVKVSDLASGTADKSLLDRYKEAVGGMEFSKKVQQTMTRVGETFKDDPNAGFIGAGKAVASGIVSLGELAVQGLTGIATAAVDKLTSGKPVGEGFEAGQASAAELTTHIKNFTSAITQVNLSPANKQDEAMANLLGLLPEAIQSAGDTVYEKTGSAIFAAGTQAGLTLLTLKPDVAAKTLNGVKRLSSGEKMSPGSKAAAEKVKSSLEELAVRDPQAAEAVANHIAQADPALGEQLKSQVTKKSAKEQELIGKDQAEASLAEKAKPTVRVTGVDEATGKPRVRLVTQDELAADMRVAIKEGYEVLAAKEKPEVPKSNVSHSVDEDSGLHTVQTLGGEVTAQESGRYLQIKRSDVLAESRGQGKTQAMMARLLEEAKARDLTLASDFSVSKDAQKVYKALERKGFTVRENPNKVSETTGSKVSLDIRVPVYEVTAGPASRAAIRPIPEPVLYVDQGKPVTRPEVAKAFTMGPSLDSVPGVPVIKGKLTAYYDQAIRLVNPEALGKEARITAATLAHRIAEQMQKDSAFYHQAAKRRTFWNYRMEDAAKFIKGFEKGEKFTDPLLNQAAEAYRNWNKQLLEKELKLGISYEPVDNYLFHVFEDGDKVAAYMEKRYGPKWGDPKFSHDRSFNLYEEAVKAGFKPKYSNPEDIMLARQHASDAAETKVQTLNDLEQAGLARKVAKGETERPGDFPSVQWRSPNGDRFWVHEKANAVLHNAFDTQSLWNRSDIAGDAFRGAMFLKNAIVPIKLGLSLFHPIHVATIDNATGMVRASKELLAGKSTPGKFFTEMLSAAAYRGFLDNPKSGYRTLRAYQGKLGDAELTAADRQSLQYMAEGGLIPEMSVQFKTRAIQNFADALQQRSLTALWHAPFAALSLLQKPMFEIWIPSLKIASYLQDVKTAIKANPALLDNPQARLLAFRKLAKSVDNRYGEMAYNTLFWNKTVKDLAVANTLSLGWQMGFLREYGGGMMDIGQAVTKEGSVAKKAASGQLDRPLFVTFYTAQALAYGGLMTWALTGQAPASMLDYIYPKNGDKNAKGEDLRVNTMFYPREFAAIYKHMENQGVISGLGHLVASKSSGLVGLVNEWATGVNSFGQEIRDPEAPAYKKMEQTLATTLWELEPISLASMQKQNESGKNTAMSLLGFTPAPRYVAEPKTEAMIKSTYDKYYAGKQTPFERAQYSSDSKSLRNSYDKGDMAAYDKTLNQMVDKYQLTPADQIKLTRSMMKESNPTITMFQRLTWQQQKTILDQMSPEERDVYLPHANKEHLRYLYEEPAK